MQPALRILITGGSGFVGRHLAEELRRREIEHVALSQRDGDLTRAEQADAVLAAHAACNVIVHLASYQAAGEFPAHHTGEQFHINTLIHTHLLEAWRRRMPHAKLLAVGCSCAYPSSAESLCEDQFLAGPIHGSVYSFAHTKRALYVGLRAYQDQYGLDGSYLIPATLFGEHDDFAPETSHVCGALVARFVQATREDWPEVEIWGDGTQQREFMDVKHFAPALLHVLPQVSRDLVNLGPGRGTMIRQLAETIARAAGYRGRLVFNPDRYVGVRAKYTSAEKLREKYGWEIPADLEPGLHRTVAWYAEHYDTLQGKKKFATCPETGLKTAAGGSVRGSS